MTWNIKHSGRRAFLRGAGASAVALPLLEYTHGHAWAQGQDKLRFITVFSHGGTISNIRKELRYDGTDNHHGVDWWRPSDPTASNLVLGPIHQPLAAHAGKMLVIEGVDNKSAINRDQYGLGGHGRCNRTSLSATVGTEGPASGASIDMVVAERLAARQQVPLDSIHLLVHGHNYGSPYYAAGNQQVTGMKNPKAAFDAIFAGVDPATPDPAIELRNTKRTSVLDGLQDGYVDFRSRISAHDRHAVDAHLDHIAALEQQLENPVICDPPTGIDQTGGPGNVVAPLMVDIIVAALRCGVTNVANLEIADILSPWTSAGGLEAGLNLDFPIGHALGHQARNIGPTGPQSHLHDDWLDYTLANRQWRMSVVAQLLDGLDDPNITEGGMTLLDNSLVLVTSEFSNGSQHAGRNQPVLLAGSAGGSIQTDRFITYDTHAQANPDALDYDSPESTHNLFATILQALGETDTQFGDDHATHDGALPGVLS